ncbi:superoxide dismutase[Cu-Zn] [Candidatus Mycobacterium methanotrophicum]|uniref:Superoxide dismutase [Cu-Zn] n=1 Tax=Candidatus Mycobacterium methanotrophicum TaxID=2943498 RepID=A0ABY4QNR0_9MYCO|nr:superoxide dismutase family protein [Candidatus Mycobacterium methanotrophicum]UQX11948.1 superoxide dismutase family protein [Candidatus Mycobacterium methanotrophicum]
MVKPATRRNVAVVTALVPLVASAALSSACKPNQPPATSPGTTPAIWTGSPPPSGTQQPGGPVAPESLTAHLIAPDGAKVATAKFEFANGYATITVETTGQGSLTPGFHGLHIHSAGKCEANSVAPTGGAPGDFLSAGGHFQAPGHTGDPESGDLTSLEVRKDGGALLVTTTDAFTKDQLLAGAGTAIVIHAGADNFANIPADRYTQVNGPPGPDQTTMSTGDAGKRVACGVIGAG